MRSAIILVGGEASRANGMEKYFFVFEGKTFIQRLTGTLLSVVDEIVLVAKNAEQCRRFRHIGNVACVNDRVPGLGPIGGLQAGLDAVGGDEVFVCACDMPCVSHEVVDYLFSVLNGYDAVIPSWDARMLEPLHAVYRRTALVAYLQNHDSFSLRQMLMNLNCLYVHVSTLRHIDPELITFTNINKIEDLEKIGAERSGRADERF